jgi:hypothetical protein
MDEEKIYNKLIDDILQKYIDDSQNTKKKIIYKVEYDKKDPLKIYKYDDSGEPYYQVILYEVSKRVYIQMFNQAYGNDFDKWLITTATEDTGKKDCVKILSIDQKKFREQFKQEEFKKGEHKYLNNIINEITTAMSESCNPFVIFNITLSFVDLPTSHANTVIIHYSEDHSKITMIYYEPHGYTTPIIHDRINIHNILDYIKDYIQKNYSTKNNIKPTVTITWGVDKCGIQYKDKVGLCMVFTRFWTYITLQLLKLCKESKKNVDCLFSKVLPIIGERRLKDLLELQFPDEEDKDKDYDVILTWMYKMITRYISEKAENDENAKNENFIQLHKSIAERMSEITPHNLSLKNIEYRKKIEFWPASRFYQEFNSTELNVPKSSNIEEKEEYMKNLVLEEQLEKELETLTEQKIIKEIKLLNTELTIIKNKNIKRTKREKILNTGKELDECYLYSYKKVQEKSELDIHILVDEINTITKKIEAVKNKLKEFTNDSTEDYKSVHNPLKRTFDSMNRK